MLVTSEATLQAGPGGRAGHEHAPGGRPVIGISCYTEQASWGGWQAPAVLLPRRYADCVAAAGGAPVLLPPLPGVEHALDRLDGLVLAGGGDIDPAAFGAPPHPRTTGIRPARDAAELALVPAALGRGLAILGICRGLQVLNVARGGTLHQHLPDLVGHDGHSPVTGGFGSHPVRVAPGSTLARVLGDPGPDAELPVPTHHHQAIDRLGRGLVATAWTADGVIEAAELAAPGPGGPGRDAPGFALAVQWHPEAGQDQRLIGGLVAAAACRVRA
jgi:putative glutamine amidotransferase